jgi:hypothetical protein
MGSVTVKLDVPYATSAAEALWYDPSRWPTVVDGFGHLQSVEGDWPRVGAKATWDSSPGGRGRVVEVVRAYEPRVSCETAVEDDTIRGTQTVTFTPRDGGTTVAVRLAYEIKDRTPITPVMDLFFIRGAQRASLQRTLRRFIIELRGDHDPPV